MKIQRREWFVLKTQRGKEIPVKRCLHQLGVHYFLPIARVDHRNSDGTLSFRRVPLFPRYIFILIRWVEHKTVMFIRGVRGFLGYQEGMNIAPRVRKSEIQALKDQLVEVRGYHLIDLSSRPLPVLKVAQVVKIVAGAYKGFKAPIVDLKQDKAQVNIQFANIILPVWLSKSQLVAAA